MAYYLGVDLGTSAVKVVLTDDSGNIASTAREGYPCTHPRPGWSEQDPELWYRATVSAVREAVESAGIPAARIEGMSFGGQMHGLVALDRDGAVIRPAILWNDGRSAEERVPERRARARGADAPLREHRVPRFHGAQDPLDAGT